MALTFSPATMPRAKRLFSSRYVCFFGCSRHAPLPPPIWFNSTVTLLLFERDWGDIELSHAWKSGKRRLSIEDEPCRRSEDYLASSGLVVWMGNEDLQLVRGAGEIRRRYLDFSGSQLFPDYRPTLRSYEKALRSRNFLLKRDASPNWRQIDAYSEVLIRHGEVLMARRAELTQLLQPWAMQAHAHVGGGIEVLAISYAPSAGPDFTSALAESRADELRAPGNARGTAP